MNSVWDAIAIIHIIIVIFPTLLLGATVLVLLCILMRSSSNWHISIFYSALAVVCIIAVLSYGIPWDVSLLTRDVVLVNCTTPAGAVELVVYFGFHSLLAIITAEISVFQFIIVRYGKNVVTAKKVTFSIVLAVVVSFGFNCIWWNGTWTEIVGSHCNLDRTKGTINTLIWMFSLYSPTVTLVILFSILTCMTVKRGVLKENRHIVTSVVTTNIVSISVHLVFRIIALVMYFSALASPQEQLGMLTIIARYINEITYTAYLITITFFNKGLRDWFLNGLNMPCCKN